MKYLIYDGTYFHKDGCFITLMNATKQTFVDTLYAPKEGSSAVSTWFANLRTNGLDPLCVTMDGEQSTMQALHLTWPRLVIQRCLFHIQREGMRWLRTYPKTEAGKTLRNLLSHICFIKSVKEQKTFVTFFKQWLKRYEAFVFSLPMHIKANFDLKRTITLIHNALPNMFHYLMDPQIPSTSNALEGFFSRLKNAYHQHRGLLHINKIRFLKWFCYFENQQKNQQF